MGLSPVVGLTFMCLSSRTIPLDNPSNSDEYLVNTKVLR